MKNQLKQGLIKKQTLTDAEVAEVEQLAHVCNTYENLGMRIGWIKLRSPHNSITNDFLYYEDGALVGYLVVDNRGTKKKELTGMVHPDHRRKGIFTTLFTAAREECSQRGVSRLILICEHHSRSGQALIAALGAKHRFSEHEMILETLQARYTFDDRLSFRAAEEDDLDALVKIMMSEPDETLEELQAFVIQCFQETNCQFYIGMLGEGGVGCKEPVGCLRVYERPDVIGIYGFVVRPEYRGRGYGRQILEETIRDIQASSHKSIMLEVDTENSNALGLYRSCGFKESRTYGYYAFDLA
ncbi:MAG: GNAT family N-acetyltransferase [Ktedonobacteraceae bacterium]